MKVRAIGILTVLLAALTAAAGDAGGATLAGGSRQDGVAVAVVPAGRLHDPSNRFFQIFSSTGGAWSLTTPRGTATNGGLIVSNPRDGAVAVLPFDASHVSAVVSMTDGRAARMGQVVPALAAGPTSLTVNPETGRSVMVSATGQVMVASSPLGQWHRLVRAPQLRADPAGRGCALAGVTAAAAMPDGTVVLGGHCARSGWSGVELSGPRGRWTWLRSAGTGPSTVLRLDPTAEGVTALIASGGRHPSLRMVRMSPLGARWSPPLGFRGSLRSTSVSVTHGGVSSYVIGLAGEGRVQAWRIGILTHAARVGPSLSDRVQAILEGPDARLTAFSVEGRAVTPLVLDHTGTLWTPQAVHELPLPYGTSG